MAHVIGVDTGGTFTDVVLIGDDGHTASAKAPTTPGDLTEGVLASLTELARVEERPLRDLLEETTILRFSGTTATNAVLTQSGSRIGVITTRGFEDTLFIARGMSAWAGGTEEEIRRAHRQRKPTPLVPKQLVQGVTERSDAAGSEVVALDESGVQDAVAALVAAGVEAIAICFLWAVRNPGHEVRARDIALAAAPGLTIHCSHDVAPTVGEYERFMTTVIDAYVGPVLNRFLRDLEARLHDHAFAGQFLIAQADGGGLYSSETRAVYTLQSGPAGGVIASANEGKANQLPNVITTDVGGTSFDVGLVADGAWIYAREPRVGQFNLSLPMIEVESVGAGGGSIAWVDELGILHVGPQSAGAKPGPAAYNAGGVEPTVTDADVVLGYLNPDYFLGGRMKLRLDLAHAAVERAAAKLGFTVVQAAAGIFEIVNAHMATLLTRRVVARGYDPRDFAVFAYGGAGGIHCAFYAKEAGAREVIVPALAGTFSAFGVATAPLLHGARRGDFTRMPMSADEFGGHLAELERDVIRRLEADDIPEDRRRLEYAVEMRYGSQVHTVRLEIPHKRYTDLDVAEVCGLFDTAYEKLYGPGSSYADAGRYLTSYMVNGYGALPLPSRASGNGSGNGSIEAEPVSQREAYFSGEFVPTNIYRYDRLRPGLTFIAPAIIEAVETTVVIPPGCEARIDESFNLRIQW